MPGNSLKEILDFKLSKMFPVSDAPTGVATNRLIAALPRGLRQRFMLASKPYEMVTGAILCNPGKPYEYAYFPHSGYISVVVTLPEHKPLGIALIGYEGMLGATLLFGTKTAPMQAIVRGGGLAIRISASKLEDELEDNPELRKIMGRYLYLQTIGLARSSACTHFHQIEQRLARLLLLTHDRVKEDRFHLTHEYLADMLGVRRSGVTVAAGALQKRKLIRYARGKITILERHRLEDVSCGCYTADRD